MQKRGEGGLMAPRRSSGFVCPESLFAPAHPSDPLFSDTYKSLAAQTLSFHIHTKPPGCHPTLDSKAFSVLSVSSVLSVLNSFFILFRSRYERHTTNPAPRPPPPLSRHLRPRHKTP